MLKPKTMKKVRITVLKSCVEEFIRSLHKAGMVDIRKAIYDGLEGGRPLGYFDDVSSQLLNLRTAVSLMRANLSSHSQSESEPLPEGRDVLDEAKKYSIIHELKSLSHETTKLSEEISTINSQLANLANLKHFQSVDFSILNTKTISYSVGKVPKQKLAKLSKSLDTMQGESTIVSDATSDIILVLYEKSRWSDVESVLSDAEFSDVDVPKGMTSPEQTQDRLKSEISSKQTKLAELKSKLRNISKVNIAKASRLLKALEIESERAGIASKFASSTRVYVINGWILEDNFNKLVNIVNRYEAGAFIDDIKIDHHEIPPTVLGNPQISSPFEFLTKSYSLPNYFEIDPTIPYFIGLPIIYGMIVGDFIYGIMSILLGLWLMKKFKNSYVMYNVSKIWVYSGFPTMVFGIIFDEWAGLSHFALLEYFSGWLGFPLAVGPLYEGFHRMSNILVLIGITAIVGMLHLGVGFILGAINEWHHNKKHSLAKIAWLGVEVGMLMAFLPVVGLAGSEFTMSGLILLVLSIIILGLTEGIVGIIELPGLLGNILSYTRIAAIGIVGIVIAELLNEFLMPLPEQGFIAIILLPLFVILHIMNCFIAMFESLVQGGRLNIVEFRSKFLHGGGEIFVPFSLKKY
ncbi:hypothetical protein KKF81_06640 [Candidatus Micrarchaeota archaeon]|nr:hypothetical protein [Candidatus Micrarchaeota archaeon]MBU1166606.1 hypothetical protein [Candidatus Micrarchaeota archaeon]MBU1887262.1 hypothetical protein [Candidatus Micrarchaeota archaeon]